MLPDVDIIYMIPVRGATNTTSIISSDGTSEDTQRMQDSNGASDSESWISERKYGANGFTR